MVLVLNPHPAAWLTPTPPGVRRHLAAVTGTARRATTPPQRGGFGISICAGNSPKIVLNLRKLGRDWAGVKRQEEPWAGRGFAPV